MTSENNRVHVRVDPNNPFRSLLGTVGARTEWRTIDRLRVTGAGIRDYCLTSAGLSAIRRARQVPGLDDPWTPVISSMGVEKWIQFTRLSFAIVGDGEIGVEVMRALVALGAQYVSLIGSQAHNFANDRLDCLAKRAGGKDTQMCWMLSSQSIGEWSTIGLLKRCDIVICCQHDEVTQLLLSHICVAYGLPLLIVSTSEPWENGEQQRRFDCRLILPGSCLLCLGGLQNELAAKERLRSGVLSSVSEYEWGKTWRASHVGLERLASNFAIRLLEDWWEGRSNTSLRMSGSFQSDGRLSTSYGDPKNCQKCKLCGLSFLGDMAMSREANPFQNFRQRF